MVLEISRLFCLFVSSFFEHSPVSDDRPTFSRINELQREQATLKAFIVNLKQSSPEERENLLASAANEDGIVRLSPAVEEGSPPDHEASKQPPARRLREGATETSIISSDDELDIAHFISVDGSGKSSSFGPSSALYDPARSDAGLSPSRQSTTHENNRNSLIANAALQGHSEYRLTRLPSIDGIATELALHLLSLHWARLTYSPAVLRSILL